MFLTVVQTSVERDRPTISVEGGLLEVLLTEPQSGEHVPCLSKPFIDI